MYNEKIRILLVDDSGDNRHCLLQLLDRVTWFAYDLDYCNDLSSAPEKLLSAAHDVYLIAYRLEGTDGVELMQQIQQQGCLVPVIIVASREERGYDLNALKSGAADFLILDDITPAGLQRIIRYAMERRRQGEALRRSEEGLIKAQRIAHLGNWDWNIATGEFHWSDEVFRIFGLRPGDFSPTYESFLGFVRQDDKLLVNRAINEALYERKPYQIEYRITLANGEERYVDCQAEVTYDRADYPMRMVGTIQDITTRRKAEVSLRLMEEKFSMAFRNSPDWIVVTRIADGRYIEVNESYLQITGYSRDEVIGRTSVELGIWQDAKDRANMLKHLDEYGRVRNLEVHFRVKSGDVRTRLWSAEVIEYGEEACLIVVAHDITEKRQLEEELLRSQVKLYQNHEELKRYFAQVEQAKKEWERTLDCIGDMVILGDRQGKIVRCNKAFQEFMGIPYERIIGADWTELLYSRELSIGTIFLQSMELSHEPTGRWFVLNPYQFRDQGDEVTGTVVTIHDMTELKQLTEQLQRITGNDGVGCDG